MEWTADIPRTYYGSMGSVVDPEGPDWRGNSHPRVVRGGHFLSHLTQENFNSSSRTISEVIQVSGFSGKPSEKSPFVGFRLALKPIREEKTFEVLDLVSPSLVLRGEGVLSDELYELPLIAKSFLSEIYSGRKYYSVIRPTPDGQYNEYAAFLDNATRFILLRRLLY